MRRTGTLIVLIICLLITRDCANVLFYSDSDVKRSDRTGIKVYTSHPFILVEYSKNTSVVYGDSDNDKVSDSILIRTRIVYLPDLRNPQYVKLKAGMGSNELNFTLTDGMLSTYGQSMDTKIPETVEAVSGLVAGLGSFIPLIDSLVKTQASTEGEGTRSFKELPSFELYELCLDENQKFILKQVLVR